jgi:hypothetical protein
MPAGLDLLDAVGCDDGDLPARHGGRGTPPVVLAAAMRAIRRVRRSLTVTTSTSIGSPFATPVCLWVLVSLQPPRVFIQKIAAVTPARL